jgi:peptide chain release factor 3
MPPNQSGSFTVPIGCGKTFQRRLQYAENTFHPFTKKKESGNLQMKVLMTLVWWNMRENWVKEFREQYDKVTRCHGTFERERYLKGSDVSCFLWDAVDNSSATLSQL